jgi:hypothetical protein
VYKVLKVQSGTVPPHVIPGRRIMVIAVALGTVLWLSFQPPALRIGKMTGYASVLDQKLKRKEWKINWTFCLKEIDTIKTILLYEPGGQGYEEAQKSFNGMLDN